MKMFVVGLLAMFVCLGLLASVDTKVEATTNRLTPCSFTFDCLNIHTDFPVSASGHASVVYYDSNGAVLALHDLEWTSTNLTAHGNGVMTDRNPPRGAATADISGTDGSAGNDEISTTLVWNSGPGQNGAAVTTDTTMTGNGSTCYYK